MKEASMTGTIVLISAIFLLGFAFGLMAGHIWW